MKPEFTEKGIAVLKSIHESSRGNGFDFGLVEEVSVPGMTAKQVGGVMRELHKKIDMYCEPSGNGWTQITFGWTNGELGEYPGEGRDFATWLSHIDRK